MYHTDQAHQLLKVHKLLAFKIQKPQGVAKTEHKITAIAHGMIQKWQIYP